ncbi:MAG: hydantoinase B/oxoprolinase family protein, partial [Candidatus Tectomicrobia bacterium]|nr:hydantoinase B/oxoprolinase family protein [Candidatus Tectomicrobia bacterium]
GVRRQVRLLCEGTYSLLADRAVLPSYGLGGGEVGRPTAASIVRRGREHPIATPGKCYDHPIRKNDVLVMLSGGGGGYGDPLARPAGAVRADVLAGYVSREEAERAYGVVLDADGNLDRRRTRVKRKVLARKREVRVEGGNPLGWDGLLLDGRRICVLGRGAAFRLNLRPGVLVELLGKRAAPLRAWVELVDSASDARKVSQGGILLDGFSRSVLGLEEGEWVQVRRLDVLCVERRTSRGDSRRGRKRR